MTNLAEVEIKLRYIFYIFVGVWGIDLLSTFIALNLSSKNLIEANPFQAQFFALGWYGWLISIFLTTTMLFFLTLLIGWIGRPIIKLENKLNRFGYYNFYLAFCCGIFCGFEIMVIINNISLLI
jgi:hypothetical protein